MFQQTVNEGLDQPAQDTGWSSHSWYVNIFDRMYNARQECHIYCMDTYFGHRDLN